MYCTSCKQDKVESVFTKGTSNFKPEAINNRRIARPICCTYIQCKLESINKPETSEASQCLLQLKKQEFENLQMIFRNAHTCTKHHKSFRDFEQLHVCRLDRVKGIDTGHSYSNDKACSMFVKSIASVSKQNIVEKLESAKFISLTMDGSTDFTEDDLESIYTRSCGNGIIEDNYLYISEININMYPK